MARATKRSSFEEMSIIEHRHSYWTTPEGVDASDAKTEIQRLDYSDDVTEERLVADGFGKFGSKPAAECFARLQEIGPMFEHRPVGYEELIEERLSPTGDEPCIPLPVAREGTAKMAAYLRASGARPSTIAHMLDVSESTITQYISDVRRGER